MWEFNVIVTSAREGRYQRLLRDLGSFGDFRRSEFLGVIVGRVEDLPGFLEALRERRAADPAALPDLGRVIPLEQAAVFRVESTVTGLKRGHSGEKRGTRQSQPVPSLPSSSASRQSACVLRRRCRGESWSAAAQQAISFCLPRQPPGGRVRNSPRPGRHGSYRSRFPAYSGSSCKRTAPRSIA